ncbi:hypothetical protein [Anatilimnocola floriformis]|uniref:hypothetical protein n=1 Tax=Anatilimnocola floriformis TaxID=2948575 RepID=UPI0020C2A089|nr:hypothetical protein [Anatilimnocola floriformis]
MISRFDGKVTQRQIHQFRRWLREPYNSYTRIEQALEELANLGFGTWELTPAGSRGSPTLYFRLYDARAIGTAAGQPVDVDASNFDTPTRESDPVDVDRPAVTEQGIQLAEDRDHTRNWVKAKVA